MFRSVQSLWSRDGPAGPVGRPWVRTGSGEALRFLCIGSGLAHGWGVSSRRFAPTGELTRGIRAITGTQCEVQLVGDEAVSAATAVDRPADRADTSFHGAVVRWARTTRCGRRPVVDWAPGS